MLILASKSPARKSLLAGAGLALDVRPADVNERELEARFPGDDPAGLARHLAEAKALAVPGAAVIGADQVLALDNERLHKPGSLDDARSQLRRLAGRTHQLHSGVALALDGAIVWSTTATATLTMRASSEAERSAVLAAEGARALESVGGYRLEGPSIRLFERIEGDYFTILGLPLLPLLAALRTHAPHLLEGFT